MITIKKEVKKEIKKEKTSDKEVIKDEAYFEKLEEEKSKK